MNKRRDAQELRRFQNKVQKKLGKRIASLRKKKGFTPGQLAQACGLGPDCIRRLERGETCAKLSTMLKIAEGLGMTMERLYDGIP